MSVTFIKKAAGLAVLLVVLWVLYVFQQVPRYQKPFAKAIDQAHSIRFENSTGKVHFAKSTGAWSVELSTGNFAPTDDLSWTNFLSSLKGFEIEDEISDRADRASEFEVDSASGTRVVVADAQGKVLADGIFGKQSSDYVHIFYRPSEQDKIYIARGLYRAELGSMDPQTWRSKDLINIPESEIKRVLLKRKHQERQLVRVSTTSWTSHGKPADISEVNNLLGKLAHLRVDGFADPLQNPTLTFKTLTYASITVEGEKTSVELRIGSLDKKNSRYPLATGPDSAIAWLSQATIDSFLKF